jgi:hypothetical protein
MGYGTAQAQYQSAAQELHHASQQQAQAQARAKAQFQAQLQAQMQAQYQAAVRDQSPHATRECE